MRNPLLDKDFLKKLDSHRNREVFVKIISLDRDENPIEEISGKATSGSISIDGDSAIRRTCSVTLAANDVNINDYYWSLNTKFKLQVGLLNDIDSNYDDIIWFPQGVFLITSFSTNLTTNNYTINISGKDKMALLNGDIGGNLTALSYDFGHLETVQSDGTIITTDIKLKDIIKEAVHTYANEPYHNIIINDLDEMGLELIEYRGNVPIYLLINELSLEIENYYLDDTQKIYDGTKYITLAEISDSDLNKRINLNFENAKTNTPKTFYDSENKLNSFTVSKVEFGEVIGYKETDLVYSGDFIGNIGDTITSACFDKIKSMLGNYEYFYNLDGQFVFQKKKIYVDSSWNNLVKTEDEETYAKNMADTTSYTYYFGDGNIITSFQNTPNLANLKNDYSIWGKRTSTSGNEVPVHLRYAIDKKPIYYQTYDGIIYMVYDKDDDKAKDLIESLLAKEQSITDSYAAAAEYRKNLIETAEKNRSTVPKTKGEDFPDGWWNVVEWAELYKKCAGKYPDDLLKAYANQGNGSTSAPMIRLADYFEKTLHINEDGSIKTVTITYTKENGASITQSSGSINNYDTAISGYLFTLDDYNRVFDDQHMTGCNRHYYGFFVKLQEEYGYKSYVYNPKIPDGDLSSYEAAQKAEEEAEIQKIWDNAHFGMDWREIIYQMALDFYQNGTEDDFLPIIAKNNKDFYPTGYTGYEQYYIDMQGFWRQLYNPFYEGSYENAYCNSKLFAQNKDQYYYFQQCSEDDEYDKTKDYYFPNSTTGIYELRNNLSERKYNQNPTIYYNLIWCGEDDSDYSRKKQYYKKVTDEYLSDGWNEQVENSPEELNFWFDFLDDEGDLSKFSIKQVGDRPKTENNDKIKAIYFKENPNIIFLDMYELEESAQTAWLNEEPLQGYTKNEWESIKDKYSDEDTYISAWIENEKEIQKSHSTAYTYLQMPKNISNMFVMSTQGTSAQDTLNELIYKYSYCIESISVNAIPVYYLNPNTRIFINDIKSGINGEYIISKLSIPLTYNGTMSITATKAIDRIY